MTLVLKSIRIEDINALDWDQLSEVDEGEDK